MRPTVRKSTHDWLLHIKRWCWMKDHNHLAHSPGEEPILNQCGICLWHTFQPILKLWYLSMTHLSTFQLVFNTQQTWFWWLTNSPANRVIVELYTACRDKHVKTNKLFTYWTLNFFSVPYSSGSLEGLSSPRMCKCSMVLIVHQVCSTYSHWLSKK